MGFPEFYKYLPSNFKNTRKFALEIISMFGSTYLCEQLFSVMNINKSNIRSCINNAHLGAILKVVSANKICPEIEKLVAQKRNQISGRNQ